MAEPGWGSRGGHRYPVTGMMVGGGATREVTGVHPQHQLDTAEQEQAAGKGSRPDRGRKTRKRGICGRRGPCNGGLSTWIG
jgi:hypothetical protein